MKQFMSRVQKDMVKLQKLATVESKKVLKKVNDLELQAQFYKQKKEMAKFIEGSFKKIEPVCQNVLKELNNKAKKSGIHLDKIEKQLKTTATRAEKKIVRQANVTKKMIAKKIESTFSAKKKKVAPAKKKSGSIKRAKTSGTVKKTSTVRSKPRTVKKKSS